MRCVSVSLAMRRVGYRLPVAAFAAAVAVAAATLLIRPRGGLIEPAAVDVTAYFSPAQLERADDFRGTQRLLGLIGLGLSGVTLAALALRRPRERFRSHPVWGAAAVGAGIIVGLLVVNLPLDAVRHERAMDVGLSTQEWGPWLGDV